MRMKWLCLHSCGVGLAASGWRMWTKAMSRMRICACFVDVFGISKFFSSKLWETSWLLLKHFVELHPSEQSPGAPAPTPQPVPAPAPAQPAPGGLLDLDLDFTVRLFGVQGSGIYPPGNCNISHQTGMALEWICDRSQQSIVDMVSPSYLEFIFTTGNPLCRL